MVHGLARQLGGFLELTSEVGRGTQAMLWLPAVSQPPTAPEPTGDEAAHSRPATILVVDDDALIGMSTADMLQDLGHTVVSADSGSQALEILASGVRVDLLLTDQTMPGMTGVELARIVRGKRPDIPILLATGYADLPAGQTPNLPRLSKPYRQAELQAEIAKLLGAH
jgi:CheY-like chemotaxis protein